MASNFTPADRRLIDWSREMQRVIDHLVDVYDQSVYIGLSDEGRQAMEAAQRLIASALGELSAEITAAKSRAPAIDYDEI